MLYIIKVGQVLCVSGFLIKPELRCPVGIWALEAFTVAAAVLFTETHCLCLHSICDLSCQLQRQQNRFGSGASSHPADKVDSATLAAEGALYTFRILINHHLRG